MTDDATAAELRALRQDVADLRADVASLLARATAAEAQAATVAAIQAATSAHAEADARIHGRLEADVARLWWLAGVALGGSGSAFLAALGAWLK